MTLRSSDLQSDGDLDSIRNSCDVCICLLTNKYQKYKSIELGDQLGDIENFNITVEAVFKKPLTRQKTEAVKIQSSNATHRMNSKSEHRQPAMLRVRMTRENDDDGGGAGGQQRGGGGGGRGAVVAAGGGGGRRPRRGRGS